MQVTAIHSYLVSPGKNESQQPAILGTAVPRTGRMWQMLEELFHKSEAECQTGIAFRVADDGKQANEARDLLLRYVKRPTLQSGLTIAERLQTVTTKTSGLGLLFLIFGAKSQRKKVVLSRFPADQGVLAEEENHSLSIKFVEKVFMKNSKTYKAALYEGEPVASAFWSGRAIDKQLNSEIAEVTNYWVRAFLASDLQTPGTLGTRRFAAALKHAARMAQKIDVQDQLASLSSLSRNVKGMVSVNGLLKRFAIDGEAVDLLRQAFPKSKLLDEHFMFDRKEYEAQLAYRSVELSSGAIMTATTERFEEAFRRQRIDHEKYRFVAEGKVIEQRFRKGKS